MFISTELYSVTSIIIICLLTAVTGVEILKNNSVLGSILSRCPDLVLHTEKNWRTALAISRNPLDRTNLTARHTACLQDQSEFLSYCKSIYSSDTGATRVVGVIAGPTMFSHSFGITPETDISLRPYWCLSAFPQQPALHTPSNCNFERLPSNPLEEGVASYCLSQAELELKAVNICRTQNLQKHLYSAFPMKPCSFHAKFTESNWLFGGLEFVCCGKETNSFQSQEYRTDIELSPAFRINESETDFGHVVSPSSLALRHFDFEQQFMHLIKNSDDRRKLLQDEASILAYNLSNNFSLGLTEKLNAVESALKETHKKLDKIWKESEDAWIRLENEEFDSIDFDIDFESTISQQEFNFSLNKPSIKIDRVQAALTQILTALRLSIEESVRHLDNICIHVPWYLLTPALPRGVFVHDKPVHMTILGQWEQDLADHVDMARSAISQLNTLMARLASAGRKGNYSMVLRHAYDDLSLSIEVAKRSLATAKNTSLSQIHAIVSNSTEPEVGVLQTNWPLLVHSVKQNSHSVWHNETLREEWIDATRLLNRLRIRLSAISKNYTHLSNEKSIYSSSVYLILLSCSICLILLIFLLTLVHFAHRCRCFVYSGYIPTTRMSQLKSSVHGLRWLKYRWYSFKHLPMTLESQTSYELFGQPATNVARINANGFPTVLHDSKTNQSVRGYENPIYSSAN